VAELRFSQFFLVDAPTRVRAFMSETQLPLITTADSLHDAMNSEGLLLPGVFGIHARMPNRMVDGRRRITVGSRRKLYKFQPVFSIVTESYASSTEDGRVGGWDLCQDVANIFDGWRAPGMISPFNVIDIAFVGRGFDVARVQHQIVLEGDTEMFTTPPL
jgi:hypothetical protein